MRCGVNAWVGNFHNKKSALYLLQLMNNHPHFLISVLANIFSYRLAMLIKIPKAR